MASKIARKTAVVFGDKLTAAAGGLNVFASFAQSGGTSATYSTDPNAIQSPQWEFGWDDALQGGLPVLEDLNSVDYVHSYQIAYGLQQGIPEWDVSTTYYKNGFCSVSGIIYVSQTDSNLGNNPVSSSANWQQSSNATQKGENLFRNAGMTVAQRGVSGTVVAASPVYTLDGWILGSTGANLNWSQQQPGNFTQSLFLQEASGMTDAFIKQRIESAVSGQLSINDYVTFQALIFNNTPNVLSPTITVNRANSVNTFSAVTAIVSAAPLQSIASGAIGIVSYTFKNTDALFYNGIECILDLGGVLNHSGAAGIYISNMDISKTPTLTLVGQQNNPPIAQVRPVGVETPNCLRFLQIFNGIGGGDLAIAALGYTASSSACFVTLQFSPMLGQPNFTNSFTNAGIHEYNGSFVSVNGGQITAYFVNGNNCVTFGIGLLSGVTTNLGCALLLGLNDYIQLSSEL